MKTDEELKIKGLEALIAELGDVDAERFISLIIKSPFDYTEWQKKLWSHRSVKDISKGASKSYKR
ncbi:MAG: hypothetical protein U5R06_23810 [candidate division KSB1 bacterium]|nr:hypothetical protein [candidate division KSB1 bacterium]